MFPYDWKMSDGYPAKGVDAHGLKVFTTFSCGGGSSMGYKLAGYDVIAANDIDPDMQRVYEANHHPKHYFLCGVRDLINMELPDELYNIDLLDGSPPCSVFSVGGLREKAWQTEKHFKEGQAKQVLDDLFFDFVDLVAKLRPKMVIAENVKGMLLGHAKWYTREVHRKMGEAGYVGKIVLLNGATMGLPQRRQRVFFIYTRKDLNLPEPVIGFNEPRIMYKDVRLEKGTTLRGLSDAEKEHWKAAASRQPVGNYNSIKKIGMFQTPYTLNATTVGFDPLEPRIMYKEELMRISSFPQDYDFLNIKPNYLMGMSVPPVMMAQVAWSLYEQVGIKLVPETEPVLA